MKETYSIKLQKESLTYNRNQAIGELVVGQGCSQAEAGRFYNITRERARQIVERYKEEHKSNFRKLLDYFRIRSGI